MLAKLWIRHHVSRRRHEATVLSILCMSYLMSIKLLREVPDYSVVLRLLLYIYYYENIQNFYLFSIQVYLFIYIPTHCKITETNCWPIGCTNVCKCGLWVIACVRKCPAALTVPVSGNVKQSIPVINKIRFLKIILSTIFKFYK